MKTRFLCLAGLMLAAMAGQVQAGFVINFDDLTAPGVFASQTPLAEEYASLGVHFAGSGEVLNSTSNFSVSLALPFSAPNFLAFNSSLSAFPPETFTFDYLVSSLSLDFAGSIGTISLSGFLNGNLVDTASLVSASAGGWSTLTLAGGSFDKIVFDVSGTDGAFVVDNLSINQSAAVPEPASFAMWGLGAIGMMSARRKRQQKNLTV